MRFLFNPLAQFPFGILPHIPAEKARLMNSVALPEKKP
jgi:hypothetical protein